MTQEVDEFLETPDSAKAEALSKEQLLEAWDKVTIINIDDDAPTIHKDSEEILRDATDTYIIELADKSFDDMTAADLEGIRTLMGHTGSVAAGVKDLLNEKISNREHAINVEEAHQAIDDLVADNASAEAQTFATYMHAYLDGQREFLDPEEAAVAGTYAHDVINSEAYDDLPSELKGSMAGFVYQTNPPAGNDENEVEPLAEETVEVADNTAAYMAHLDEVIEAGSHEAASDMAILDARKAQAFKDMLEGRADEGSMAERLQRQADIMDWYQQDTFAINDDGEDHPGEFGKVTSVAQRADEYLDEIAEQAQSEEFQRDAAFFAAPEVVQSYVERLHGVMELPQNENEEENTTDLGEEFLNQVNEHRAGIGLDAIENPLDNDEGIIDVGFEEEQEDDNDFAADPIILGGEELEDDNDVAIDPLVSEGEELDDTPDAGAPEAGDELDDTPTGGTPADTDENDGAVDEVAQYMAHLQEDVDNGVLGAAEFQDALAKKDKERTFDDVNAEMKRQMAVGRYMENDYENMPRQIKSDSVKIDAQDEDFMVDKENQRLVAQNGNPETVAEYVSYKDEHHFDAKKFLEEVNKLREENGWGEPFAVSNTDEHEESTEEKSEERKAVEEYLESLSTTEKVTVEGEEKEQPIAGAEEYKKYMLRQLDLKEEKEITGDDPTLADSLKTYKYMQYLEGHAADLPEAPDFVKEKSGEYVKAQQLLVTTQDPKITDAGISDNIDEVKAFDEYLKTFGTGNDALDQATKEIRAKVDEERANHGQMPVEEALFLANTDEEILKKRDEEINKLLEGDDIKNMLDADMTTDADWKQINDFYDLVKVDRMDSANLVMPNPIDKNVKEEATAPSSEGAEGEAHEEPETEESKKKKQSGQDLKKDLYDLAVLKAGKELMMAEDYDALSEEDRKKRLADLTKQNMAEMTYQLAANQFAYDTGGAGHFRKDGSLPNSDEISAHGKEVLGYLMGDPSAKGFIHISDTVAAATLAANTVPLKNFTDQLQNKVKSSALFQKVKALDERFTKKYPKAYPLAKQIIAKGATRLAIGYATGPIGLAVYSGIETVKACKKIRDDYRQQKREGNVDGKWNYFKKNWPKVVGAAASVAGTAVAAWTGIDAIKLNGVDGFGAIGHMFSGEHAASSSVGFVDAAKNLGKNAWGGVKNIVTGNLHEYSAKQVASLARASMTLASGLGAASQSFAKGDWKQGWAQFGGAFVGATIAAVMLESQAAHAAEMPTNGGNSGSGGAQLGQEAGGQGGTSSQGTTPSGWIKDPATGKLIMDPKLTDLSDVTKDIKDLQITPETPEETIAKAQETIKNVENFKTPKVGLNGGRVDIGVKAPKIEIDEATKEAIEKPIPKVPEDYKGSGDKGGAGGATEVKEDEVKQDEIKQDEEQKKVIDEQQEETTITAPERLAVELDDPKETRVDLSAKMENGEDASLKIETAKNGVLAHKVVGDKPEEIVSAVDKETGLRRTVKVTYDNQGRVVSEQEMTDQEARKFVKDARKLDNATNKENGGVSDEAKKTYKMIKRASSTEIRHPKSVVSMQQNEDGSQFSLTRGRNGLSGITTLDGKEAHFSIIKDKEGTVHYVVTEENGHQRLMTDEEQEKVSKQIEESGDKKSIRKLHKFAKKTEYEAPQQQNEAQQQQQSADAATQEVVVESSPKELGFKQGNTKMSVTLDGNGRAQYTVEQNGIKETMNSEQVKDFNKTIAKAQSEGTITQDNLALQRVRTSEEISSYATKKLGLDNESMKVSVPVADGKVQAAIAVADNGAVYHPTGGKTTYAVVDEHKQVKAYTIQDNKSVPLNAQDTARFVGVLKEKGMVDANSSLGKAINNMQQTAANRQSQQTR